ncbi:MAG: MaoC/PaaZ C-terminal domain-containing protein [Candidatus Saccharimonas sp.]
MTTVVGEQLYAQRVLSDKNEWLALSGQDLGVSRPFTITQNDVNLFGAVTRDSQWIHIDPRRAKESSPFGGTIAHGFYTLSLATSLLFSVIEVDRNTTTIVNCGLNELKFLNPVPVGSQIQLAVRVDSVVPKRSGVFVTFGLEMRVLDGQGDYKSAFVAQLVFLYVDAVQL